MREFTFKTLGFLLGKLAEAGIPIKRSTFYRLERKLGFPPAKKTMSGWRVYTDDEISVIVTAIKNNYNV
jgi:predicted DNA-binding transcriptional regulator AlpA